MAGRRKTSTNKSANDKSATRKATGGKAARKKTSENDKPAQNENIEAEIITPDKNATSSGTSSGTSAGASSSASSQANVPPVIDMTSGHGGNGGYPVSRLRLVGLALLSGLVGAALAAGGAVFLLPGGVPASSAQLAVIEQQVEHLQQEITARQARLQAALSLFAETDGRLAALADMTRQQEAFDRKLADLQTALGRLERFGEENRTRLLGQMDSLQRLGRSLSVVEQRQPAAAPVLRSAVLAGLASALTAGRPYTSELAAARLNMPLDAQRRQLDRLLPFAETGIPSLPQITAAYRELLPDVLAQIRAAAGQSWTDQWLARIGRIVSVRRTGDVSGTGIEAGLARIEKALEAGQAAQAWREFQSLPSLPSLPSSGSYLAVYRCERHWMTGRSSLMPIKPRNRFWRR